MRTLALATVVTSLLTTPVFAAEVDKGRELAQALCARCHMGEGQGEKHGSMGVPSFHAVANRPRQTEEMVVVWLQSVPPMMPDHHLTRDEMQALAAFIMTLRAVP